MASFFATRDFSWGINSLDAEHLMDSRYGVIAKNVVVSNGFVETRPGLTLWNKDSTKSGGITMMREAYFRDGTKQLIFANDDDYYHLPITAATDTAWSTIGDMGTAVNNPYAFMHKDVIAFGTGITANTPKKWDNTTYSSVGTPADASGDLRFMRYHQGANIAYLLGAGNTRDDASHNNSILYYTTDPDDWSTGGTISIGTNDGQSLTGIASHSNIIAYKEFSKYILDIVFEESGSGAGTHVMRVLERLEGGAVNHEVIQVALNDVLSLSRLPGEGVRGVVQVQTKTGGSESRRYSTKLGPYLKLINFKTVATRARSIIWDEKYFLSLPISGSATNNVTFIGHLNQLTDDGEIPWTVADFGVGDFAIYQNSDSEEILLISDADNPYIYKWDENALSDNQGNISAKFRTKRYDLGDIGIDTLKHVIISGQMSEPTELDVSVFVDGTEVTYRITKEQFINPTDKIWSHVIGSEVVGGNTTDSTRPRFLAVLQLPDSHRVGSETQFDFASSGSGMYWRLDYLSINEPVNIRRYGDKHNVSTLV